MKDLVQKTNGLVVNDEEFTNEFFIPNLERYFRLNFGPEAVFGSDLSILNSQQLYFAGAIGNLAINLANKKSQREEDQYWGEYGSNEFILSSPTKNSGYLFFFGLTQAVVPDQTPMDFQIQVKYFDRYGQAKKRVFTYQRDLC